MSETASWETEGARPRAARPGDDVPVPRMLRALTWTGGALVVAAACLFVAASLLTADEGESEAHLLARLVILVVVGVAVATVGAVSLLLRLVAGAVVRR